MIKISSLKINYQQEPVGIRCVEQIHWQLYSEEPNVFQTSYEVQIASDNTFQNILYQTGKIFTEDTVCIGTKELNQILHSSQKYFIRVKADTTVGETNWKTCSFTTALINTEEWNAKFITIEDGDDSQRSKGTYLRKEVLIAKPVTAAYAYTTALGLYHFYINEEKVGCDEFTPGWTSYNKHLLYQTYDVTSLLKAGCNTLGAHLGAGWYKGDVGFARLRNHYGKYTAFSCQLVVEYEDGTHETFISDYSWKGTDSPVLFSELYDGELYDARCEIDGWNQNGCKDALWASVHEIPFNISVLSPQSGAKVRQITALPAKQIFTTPKGETVVDFGQNLTGWIAFHAKGHRSEKIEMQCFETLDADGNVYTENLRTAKAAVTYICKDEEEVYFHENFSFQGFRYAKISAWPGIPQKENFTAYAIHSEMSPTGYFECSNPDINQLHHNVLWSMKGNFLDIPTDCPQRDERLGWTGDAQIFCRTATYLMDTYVFFRKWLVDVAADQTEEGGIPHVVPDILIGKSSHDPLLKDGEHSAAAWADVSVILPWTLYLMYGDTYVLKCHYQSMRSWIDYMTLHSHDHIWNYQFQFGDWVALDAEEGSCLGATPNDLTCTAYYAYSTTLFSKIAKITGHEEDTVYYSQLAEKIKFAYQNRFFTNGRLNVQTQTAQILSLYFDLVPANYKENVIHDLLQLLKKENGHLVTGFVGTPYFCHVLSQNGHTEEAYDLLLKEDFPSWLYQVKQGATTIWEHWDGIKPDGTMWSPDMNSLNHYAYGSIAEWLYRTVAGIDTTETEPGFKRIIIAPHIGGNLNYVKASYDSIHGTIRSEWNLQKDIVTMKFTIPCNTHADIFLYNATKIIDDGGLDFHSKINCTQCGSGTYCIVYKISKEAHGN